MEGFIYNKRTAHRLVEAIGYLNYLQIPGDSVQYLKT
jgi:hypothetical protein